MQYPESISAVRPDEQKRVLSFGNTSETLLHVRHRLHFLAVDAQNHISGTQASVVSRAARNHTFNHHSLQILSATQLLADVGSHFAKAEAPARLAVFTARRFFLSLIARAHLFERDREFHAFAIAQYAQLDGGAWASLSYVDLQLAGVADFLAIERRDQIANLQASFRSRRSRFHLSHDRAAIVLRLEELRVLGRDVGDAQTHVSVADLAVTNDRFDRRTPNLRRNCEAHAGELAGSGDQERVNADHFAARIHQRAAGVARVNGRIGLNELPWLAGVVLIGVRAIQRTHDSASHCAA